MLYIYFNDYNTDSLNLTLYVDYAFNSKLIYNVFYQISCNIKLWPFQKALNFGEPINLSSAQLVVTKPSCMFITFALFPATQSGR